MGQRTQVLIIKENNKGERESRFYHLQWGFGRAMYFTFMDLFLNDYNKDTFKGDYNFFNLTPTTNSRLYDITDDVNKEVLAKADPNDLSTIRNVFDYGDNNNGGLVIYVKENQDKYNLSEFKIGFLLGDEDAYTYDENDKRQEIEQPFARYLTPQEYGEMNGGSCYSDPDFTAMFDSFCKYFEVEYLK